MEKKDRKSRKVGKVALERASKSQPVSPRSGHDFLPLGQRSHCRMWCLVVQLMLLPQAVHFSTCRAGFVPACQVF